MNWMIYNGVYWGNPLHDIIIGFITLLIFEIITILIEYYTLRCLFRNDLIKDNKEKLLLFVIISNIVSAIILIPIWSYI